MSTLRVSNIEAKADVSSPSVNEKVKVTNSNGELLIHIDGATSGITTVGISTSGESFRFDSNQNVTFFGDITGTGLDVNGNADVSGNLNVGGVLTYEDVTNIDSVGLITARSGIRVLTGTATTALVVEGNARVTGILTVGTSSLTLDGTNNVVNVGTALTLGHTQGLQFHTQNLHSQGFEINNINATGIITATTISATDIAIDGLGLSYSPSNIEMRGDANVRITLGTAGGTGANNNSNWIYGNGSNVRFNAAGGYYSYEVSGNERLRITSGGKIGIGTDNPDELLEVGNGTVVGGLKVSGQSTGITDEGLTFDWVSSGNAARFFSESAGDSIIQFYTTSSGTRGERLRIDSDGHLQIRIEGVASMSGQDTRHTRYIIRQSNGQEAILGSVFAQGKSNWGGDLVFASKTANGSPGSGLTERLRINSDGDMLPGGDNSQDLGSSSKRWQNIYTADLQMSNEGSANDVDGTWGKYTIQEGENDLFLINRRSGKRYKFNLTEVN